MDNNFMHTMMVWAGIGFVFFALTMLAVLDVARKEFRSPKVKLVWGIVAVFPVLGWFFYLLFGFWGGKVVKSSE